MKVLSNDGLTKLITLIKNNFIKTTDVEAVSELEIDSAPTSASANLVTSGGVYTALSGKQDTLVSGTNIKTINNNSILGSGNIEIQGGSGGTWSEITGKPFSSVDATTLKVENSVLKVNTTDNAEQDNTRPITSSGVNTIVGNINALLTLI